MADELERVLQTPTHDSVWFSGCDKRFERSEVVERLERLERSGAHEEPRHPDALPRSQSPADEPRSRLLFDYVLEVFSGSVRMGLGPAN